MARSKEAIARLDEKALRGGGKSEDQPLSEECRTTLDVRAKRRKLSLYWPSAAMRIYVYYYISLMGRPSREAASPFLNKKKMKSTILIYGHESELTKADAKRIAFLLGAQTTCTRHIGEAIMNGVENFVLCLPSLNAEGAEREWQDFIDTFRSINLTGKCLAIYVPSDNPNPNRLKDLKYVLYTRNARCIINQSLDKDYSIDDWICAISPSL